MDKPRMFLELDNNDTIYELVEKIKSIPGGPTLAYKMGINLIAAAVEADLNVPANNLAFKLQKFVGIFVETVEDFRNA